MSKTPNNPLAAAMRQLTGPPTPSANRAGPADKKRPRRGSGTRVIAGHFDAAVQRQLRVLAAQEDRTIQGLLEEALNDLFAKRNLPPIA